MFKLTYSVLSLIELNQAILAADPFFGLGNKMSDNLNFTPTVVTLSANTSTKLVGRNLSRQYLAVQNTGTGSATIAFASPAVIGAGLGLDPASALGGQGGSWEWSNSVPTQPLYAISSAGTTIVVIEG